jgi:hypothetical protein
MRPAPLANHAIRVFMFVLVALMTQSFLVRSELFAEVGDVTIETDHPQYPGEGALQTPEQCAQVATKGIADVQEQALALYKWLLTHQWHLHSPQEWSVPGAIPGARPDDPEMMVYDANRARFSYGYGLCGTVHAWNEVYWKALGLTARRRAFPGHTNSEVFVAGKWRMFDTDMAGIVMDRDGSVAGYDDIARDLTLLDRPQAPVPRYPFAWPSDFDTMKRGWQEVAAGGDWYRMYNNGYAGQPAIVHLRSGETFTRYFGPDAFGGPSKRRFWHKQKDGPQRLWTFTGQGEPFHNGERSNCRGNVAYGNAVFEYSPPLSRDEFRQGASDVGRNVSANDRGLASSNGEQAFVVFEHFSPYVIGGDPVDDEDPMTKPATDGVVIEGESTGEVTADISADQGQSWTQLEAGSERFRWDATEATKGRYGWRLRLTWAGSTVLKSLKATTTCQTSQAIYPRLKPGGSRVTFRAGGLAVVPVLPRFEREDATVANVEMKSLRSENMAFVGRKPGERLAYTVRGPKPASVVFRVESPTMLAGISAAARYTVRSPTPEGARYDLAISLDEGRTWSELGIAEPPTDNEYSSGWVHGTRSIAEPSQKSALVRVGLNGGGSATGLITAEMYGIRRTPNTSNTEITYGWREDGILRQHTFRVSSGATEQSEMIPTGPEIQDQFVQMKVR